MNNDKTDFTQGSILKKLCLFMLPILGALVLQAAYGVVDLLVVGRFGSTSGLSGVSTGSQLLNLVTFVVTQLAMGVTVLIARYLGEKKPERIGAVLGGAALATVLAQGVSVAFALVILTKKDLPFSVKKTDIRFNPQCRRFLSIGLPVAYFMSSRPDASLTMIGLAAPISTLVGVILNTGFYIHMNKASASLPDGQGRE